MKTLTAPAVSTSVHFPIRALTSPAKESGACVSRPQTKGEKTMRKFFASLLRSLCTWTA